MRNGTWSKSKNYGEGKNKPGFPKQPQWFEDRGLKIRTGTQKIGFSEPELMEYLK